MKYIISSVFVFSILFAVFILSKYYFAKKSVLSAERKVFFKKKIKKIAHISLSPKEKVLEFDKVLHHILKDFGYKGTLGEILKSEPKVINDLNKIWKLHKLRNKLAHDFDILENRVLIKKAKEFELELLKMI